MMRVRAGGVYVDATLGGGGYAERLLEALESSGRLVGIDQDSDAIQYAMERLGRFKNFTAVQANFADLDDVLDAQNIQGIDGIVFDLGVSSHLLDDASRGFSFRTEGPLDMRMDTRQTKTARDLVNHLPVRELERILKEYGEEPFASRIARRIVEVRHGKTIQTTSELEAIVYGCYPAKMRHGRTHPATRTFQALRIAVNDELQNLRTALEAAIRRLATSGVICCVSYHSLEDRIAKQTFQQAKKNRYATDASDKTPRLEILTPKPLGPTSEEIGHNPRARSAKLRAAQKA